MEDKRQPTTVTHMLSDPMWSLDHNIVVDKIARTVAEEPIGSGMLHAPMALAWRKKSKINFYSINDEFNIPSLSMVERIAKSVAEEPLEPGANKEDVPQHVIDEERGDMIRQRRKEQAQMEMYDDPYLNWSGHR
jgi:hypothetical protein